jgi:SAM-dependent methyltransferase
MAHCHLCGQKSIHEVHNAKELTRVTSDCRPWHEGGRIGICLVCNTTQTILDDDWRADCARIYQEYQFYYQGDGAEQTVFSLNDNAGRSRSETLVTRLLQSSPLVGPSRILDVGCGNGAFLRALSGRTGDAELFGFDLSETYRETVEAIPQFRRLYVGSLGQIEGRFDLISMIHSLEHIENPLPLLTELVRHLTENGFIFVQVPNVRQSPFDLVVADHATHFTPETLTNLLQRAGLNVVFVSDSWVSKEISCIARLSPTCDVETTPDSSMAEDFALLEASVNWLHSVRQLAKEYAKPQHGLFGTAIAAIWTFGLHEEKFGFFVDEDRHRIGRTIWGCPILDPLTLPTDTVVFLAMPPLIADSIKQRLEKLVPHVQFIRPPQFN